MKRRSFLAALVAAPVAVTAANILPKEAPPRFRMKTRAPERGYARGHRSVMAANIGVLTAGVMRSANGRMAIDLGADCITLT